MLTHLMWDTHTLPQHGHQLPGETPDGPQLYKDHSPTRTGTRHLHLRNQTTIQNRLTPWNYNTIEGSATGADDRNIMQKNAPPGTQCTPPHRMHKHITGTIADYGVACQHLHQVTKPTLQPQHRWLCLEAHCTNKTILSYNLQYRTLAHETTLKALWAAQYTGLCHRHFS